MRIMNNIENTFIVITIVTNSRHGYCDHYCSDSNDNDSDNFMTLTSLTNDTHFSAVFPLCTTSVFFAIWYPWAFAALHPPSSALISVIQYYCYCEYYYYYYYYHCHYSCLLLLSTHLFTHAVLISVIHYYCYSLILWMLLLLLFSLSLMVSFAAFHPPLHTCFSVWRRRLFTFSALMHNMHCL